MKYYIYKIYCKDTSKSEFYIGSTNSFSSRKCRHKKNVNNKVGKLYWCKLYMFIRLNGGWDNFTMEILEQGEVECTSQIRKIEQKFIDSLLPTLNSVKASRNNM